MPTPKGIKHKSDLHRLLRIMMLIRARPDWTPTKLASEFEVSLRCIHRDIEKLHAVGVPIVYDHGRRGYTISGDFYFPPVQLTPDEALALTVLCEDVAGRGQIELLDPAYRALQKIEAQMPPSLREEVSRVMDHVAVRTARAAEHAPAMGTYELLRRAIADGRAVECAYAAAARGPAAPGAPFLFEPYALYFNVRAWYAFGRHGGRGEVRCLKLSRMSAVTPTEQKYRIPAGFSLDDHLGNAWNMIRGKPDHAVELLVNADFADTVTDTRWHHTQQSTRNPDGSATLRFTVSGLDEIVWWILANGPHMRVVSPPELADRVRNLAADTAAMYASAAPKAATPRAATHKPPAARKPARSSARRADRP